MLRELSLGGEVTSIMSALFLYTSLASPHTNTLSSSAHKHSAACYVIHSTHIQRPLTTIYNHRSVCSSSPCKYNRVFAISLSLRFRGRNYLTNFQLFPDFKSNMLIGILFKYSLCNINLKSDFIVKVELQ